jgi:hypothetical protein
MFDAVKQGNNIQLADNIHPLALKNASKLGDRFNDIQKV